MTKVPEVVIMNQYTPSYKHLNFNFATKKQVYDSTMNMFDYYSDNKKKAFYMLDYFSGKIGKDNEMNIVFENGEYATKDEVEKRKRQYAKYIENSNIYKLVISFPENYLEENVDIKKFEKELAKHIIPMFLKKCNFYDVKNMSFQFSLHTNSLHKHFHLSFAEKKPNYKSYGKKLKYRYKGELTQSELGFLKNEIQHYIKKEKVFTPLLIVTNKEIDELKKYFNPKEKNYILKDRDDILLEDKIKRLGELLNEKYISSEHRIKFNSIKNKEIKILTKDIKKHIFDKSDESIIEDYRNFKSSIKKLNDYFISVSISNNSRIVDTSLIKRKEKYLDNYIYNAIVNHANYINRRKSISEDKILQEIIFNNFKKNKRQTKFDILSNVLSNKDKRNKFINKYKIKQAVYNINYELEEAEKEFDKLFKNNDYSKNII